MAHQILDGLDRRLSAESATIEVEPLAQPLSPDPNRSAEQPIEQVRGAHAEDKLHQVFGLVHRRADRPHDAVQLALELFPDHRFDRIGISQRHDANRLGLTVPVQPADTLMQAHRIPRQIDVDQRAAALLKVDPLTAGFCRHKKPEPPGIEGVAGVLSPSRQCDQAAIGMSNIF